jgi:hypothetical protein
VWGGGGRGKKKMKATKPAHYLEIIISKPLDSTWHGKFYLNVGLKISNYGMPPKFCALGFMLESCVKLKSPLENERFARGGEKPPDV